MKECIKDKQAHKERFEIEFELALKNRYIVMWNVIYDSPLFAAILHNSVCDIFCEQNVFLVNRKENCKITS